MKNLVWIFSKAYKKFITDRCTLFASALVHATVFSLFPLIIGIISLSIYILGSSEGIIERMIPILKQVFPVGIDEIIKNISVLKQTSIVIAVISILTFVWSAASVFRAIESTLNVIWKVKNDRPFFKKNLLTIGASFLVFLLFFASMGITIWTNALRLGRLNSFLPVLNIIISILLFGLIYWYFPNKKVKIEAAYFGAIFTGVLWELSKFLFTIYITKGVDFTKIFGSLSAIVLLLLWIYYTTYIFLFGAELSYVYARRKILK